MSVPDAFVAGRVSMGGMDLLLGKAAVITGGEGSIGLATARAFVAEGARVCLIGLEGRAS